MPVGHLLRFSSEVIAGMSSNYCLIVPKSCVHTSETPQVSTRCIHSFTNCYKIIAKITIAGAHTVGISVILFIAHVMNGTGSREVCIHSIRRKLVWRICAIVVERSKAWIVYISIRRLDSSTIFFSRVRVLRYWLFLELCLQVKVIFLCIFFEMFCDITVYLLTV